jgi:glycosidase
VAGLLAGTALLGLLPGPAAAELPSRLERPPQDDVIYFLMLDRFANGDTGNDTGGIAGDATAHGFDPTSEDFFNGGDLKGLTERLDYIKGLGATAIWVTPVFRNDAVQFRYGKHTAGYHGYWINDFLGIDPHFGTKDDFRRFVEEAHKRDMKVILDIVINHTSDVVHYRECHDPAVAGPNATFHDDCPYRPVGQPPYTPYILPKEAGVKNPPWLNDVSVYNNRGDSTFKGESSLKGDFAGLDDVNTLDPRVVQGMIDIYKHWISEYRIDGYRIDTARHVETPFWQAFIPAILDHAKAQGIPNFYIFGEVYEYEPEVLSRFTRDDRFPAVLDFAFQAAAGNVASGASGPAELAAVFAKDGLYGGGTTILPTFLGNHDMGRYAYFLSKHQPGIDDGERVKRVALAHALMMFSRGVPVIYYGDEQGFVGKGGYGGSRASLFPTKVPSYAADDLIGTAETPAEDNFDPGHPIYQALAAQATIRASEPALRQGSKTVLRADDKPGILAFLRGEAGKGGVLVVANTNTAEAKADLTVPGAGALTALMGTCPVAAGADGAVSLTVPALSVLVCRTGG